MKKVWEVTALEMEGRDGTLQQYLSFEEEIKRLIKKGKLTMDSPAIPACDQDLSTL